MTGRIRRALPALVGMTTVVVVATLGAGAASAWRDDEVRPVEKVVLFASDGMRPDLMEKYAKAGACRRTRNLMKRRRDRQERHAPGLPAEHGRRLVHDGHRHVPVRARLDEQHLLPHAATRSRTGRRSRARACSRPTRSRTRPSVPARRSRRSTGSAARPRTSTVRRSTSRTSSRTAACSSAPRTRSSRRARPSSASPTRSRRARPGRRLDRRADGRSGGHAEADDVDDQLHLRRAEPEPHLQRLLLRQRQRRRRQATTTRSSARSARPARARRSTSRSATSSRSS